MIKDEKTILVTGGCGYVGCVLIPKLLTAGYKVRVFDKLIFGVEPLETILGSQKNQVEIVQGDITCPLKDSLFDNVEAVIHLAGLSNDPTAEFNPKANIQINVGGTKNVADACIKNNIGRFIFASSTSVYYTLSPYTGMLDEGSEVSPTAPYSLSKKLAEEYLLSIRSANFHPTLLRKGTIFGWSPRMRYDLVVNAFIRAAWKTGRLTVHNGGEIWRPLLSINDACDAYIKILSMPIEKISGQTFNLLHKNYRILELAHWVKHVLSSHKQIEVDVQYNSNTPPRSYQVSGDRFKLVFGYSPSTGISTESLKMWECISQNISSDFDNPKYYNIQWLIQLHNISEILKRTGNIFPE